MSNDYLSPTSGEKCTCAQYIAEIVTRREADKKSIPLTGKWWNVDPWRKKYAKNVIQANSLLKIYSETSIIRALKRKECSWQWSLYFKEMHDIFRDEQSKWEREQIRQAEQKTIEVVSETKIKPTNPYGKQSKLDKLRDD